MLLALRISSKALSEVTGDRMLVALTTDGAAWRIRLRFDLVVRALLEEDLDLVRMLLEDDLDPVRELRTEPFSALTLEPDLLRCDRLLFTDLPDLMEREEPLPMNCGSGVDASVLVPDFRGDSGRPDPLLELRDLPDLCERDVTDLDLDRDAAERTEGTDIAPALDRPDFAPDATERRGCDDDSLRPDAEDAVPVCRDFEDVREPFAVIWESTLSALASLRVRLDL